MSEEYGQIEQEPINGGFSAENARRGFVRTPLIISLFGLILSVFYGVGGLLSPISLIMGLRRIKIRRSDSLKWAITISAVTIALSLLYVAALAGAILFRVVEIYEAEEVMALI